MRERLGLIGFGAVRGDDTLSADGDVVEAAARLFDALHRADAAADPPDPADPEVQLAGPGKPQVQGETSQ